jgi:tRNA(Arg) A34 adenosine deaminase TadA
VVLRLGTRMSLEEAIKHAKKNPVRPRGKSSISRFGCILSNGSNTYFGWNSYKSHPLQARFAEKTGSPEKLSIHSEISAIVEAVQKGRVRDFRGYTMYIARLLGDGTPALAKPCLSCLAAITEFGINQVEWTT